MNITEFNFFKFNNNLEILDILKTSYLNSNLSHSTIIYGDKGIGKSIFLKYFICNIFNNFAELNDNINNKHIPLILNNSHPNLKIISLLFDEKNNKFKNYITIDQIRNIENFIYQSTFNEFPKIILIDSADDLNISSSNSLLKILEEPKKNTYFFLISHQPSKLLDTIRSRCIKFNFKKTTFSEFKEIIILNSENSINNEDIEYLFHLSNGSPGIALDFFLQDTKKIFDNILEICKEKKVLTNNIINFSNEINKYEKQQFENFLILFKFILTNILKIQLGIEIKNIINKTLAFKIYEISKYINKYSCFRLLDYLNNYENNLFKLNLDKKLFTINLFAEIVNN